MTGTQILEPDLEGPTSNALVMQYNSFFYCLSFLNKKCALQTRRP